MLKLKSYTTKTTVRDIQVPEDFVVLKFIQEKHYGQTRITGEDYVNHCLNVYAKCTSEYSKILALAHDILEDTDVTDDELMTAGWSWNAIEDLYTLSHDSSDTYSEYIKNLTKNGSDEVKEVKFFDLCDNISTLFAIEDDKTRSRLTKKYVNAWVEILSKDYFFAQRADYFEARFIAGQIGKTKHSFEELKKILRGEMKLDVSGKVYYKDMPHTNILSTCPEKMTVYCSNRECPTRRISNGLEIREVVIEGGTREDYLNLEVFECPKCGCYMIL